MYWEVGKKEQIFFHAIPNGAGYVCSRSEFSSRRVEPIPTEFSGIESINFHAYLGQVPEVPQVTIYSKKLVGKSASKCEMTLSLLLYEIQHRSKGRDSWLRH